MRTTIFSCWLAGPPGNDKHPGPDDEANGLFSALTHAP